MPVDGVEVDRVALGHRPQSFPARQQGGDQARLVQVLPGRDHRRTGSEQRQEGVERDRRPRLGQRRAGLGQPQHGGRGDRQSGLGGGRGGAQHQRRIGGRVDRPGQHGFALLFDDAVGQRGAFDPADQPAADIGHRALRAAQRAVDPMPGQIAGVADGAGDAGDMAQQHVTVVQAHQFGDRVLVLDLQPVGRSSGQGLHHVPDVQQCRPGLLQPLVRAVGDPGGGNGPHHHQVAQPAPGFLEIGGGGEGQFARSRRPLLAGLAQRLQPVLGIGPPVGQHPAVQRDGQFRIAGDVPQVEHAEHRRQVGAGDLPGPADRSDRVVEPDLGIPDRVPEPLGEHAGVGGRRLRRMQQHQVEVGERRQLAAAVTPDRHQGDSPDVDPGILGQLAEPTVGQSGQSASAEPDREHRSGSATGFAVLRNRPPSPQANSAYPYRAS